MMSLVLTGVVQMSLVQTSLVQLVVERVLNSLPEGLLIALGAWLLLRVMGQNSRTRFAVWLVALASVAALPFLSGLGPGEHGLFAAIPHAGPHAHPEFSIPAFWAGAFFLLWVAIAIAALMRVAVGVWQVRQIRRSSTEIPAAELDPEMRTLLAETKRPVRLLVSDKARVPAALGFRNAAIVLPAWALSELSTADLRPILIHELAHLRRRDDWTNLVQKSIRALLFFHPAVWWIDARLSLEREMACDDAVLAATGNARAYAGCLIELLEKGCSRRGWSMAQAAVARARDASIRIARILRIGPGVSTRVGRVALGASAGLALACTGIALCAPQFVAFVPLTPASTARSTPLIDNFNFAASRSGVMPSRANVVPASFHPAETPAVHGSAVANRSRAQDSNWLRQASLTQKQASTSPGRAATSLHQASLTKKHAAPDPVVMASFTGFPDADPSAPTVVIFRSVTGATSAQLRAATADAGASHVRKLQSSENPAVQIQIVQMVDPATGTPVEVLEIMLVVPQQGAPSQSI